jgi:microcystin-dependent protein
VLAWLSKDSIPARINVCISLPNSEIWKADFLGAFLQLTFTENWETFGLLSSEEMADEWRAIFFEFVEGQCSMIPIATILPFAGQSAPSGYLLCHGQTVLRADYPDLFGVIGTIYGASVSGTEFNIPDLRHMVPAGVDEDGPSGFDLGDIGGELTHVLTASEMPTHTHVQNQHTHVQNSHSHIVQRKINTTGFASNIWAAGNAIGTDQSDFSSNIATATNQNTTPTNQNTGGGESHNNMPPYLVVNYIIKY